MAKCGKDTKMSKKNNVHRLERHPTSSEALANGMGLTIGFFCRNFVHLYVNGTQGLFFSYPGVLDIDKKVPKSMMHVHSNFFLC